MSILISIIIPARNEAALITQTVEAVLAAQAVLYSHHATSDRLAEVIVVDNASTDQTAAMLQPYLSDGRIQLIACDQLGSALARNAGAQHAQGDVLVFLDADTLMPPDALWRMLQHATTSGYLAGITRLAPAERQWRAQLWWWFWSQVRRLPIPRAKAMPALMFCTRAAFAHFGPFDESVSIGEEWPILARIYKTSRERFIYDHSLIARSSSRRMELQRFGYARTFGRYIWAVLHRSGRIGYPDTVRHTTIISKTSSKEYAHANSALRHPLHRRIRGRTAAATTRRDGDTARIAGDSR